MRQTWRWFGPKDIVSVNDMRQAGVEGVVSALHHVPPGELWSLGDIETRKREISMMKNGMPSGLTWDVVESLPVSEAIKKQKGDWRAHIQTYRASMRNLAAAGIPVICYNFMPVLDWTRTDLAYGLAHGGNCMRFDMIDFAAFDIHILRRPNAAQDFDAEIIDAANRRFSGWSDDQCKAIARNVVFGLPGAADHMSMDDVRQHLAEYDAIPPERLRQNLIDFLSEIMPLAEELGLRFCCHPDDPPFPLLGLPRVMSTLADYQDVLAAVDSPSNGVTLCTGSLGARPDNDLPAMMEALGDRVHFLHLRNVKREGTAIAGSFHEAEHLGGDTDMVAVIAAVVKEEARRRTIGRTDAAIPFRPDHGQNILDDLTRQTQPGYPSIGRLKGLAELRGIIKALEHPVFGIIAAR